MQGRVIKKWRKHNWIQGIYKSPKSTKLNHFRSSWELKLYQFLDASPLVKCWESECIKIPYILRGKVKNYLPDILINKKLLIEVKPASQINTPMNRAKFKAAKKFCEMREWTFQIITKELMSPSYLTEQVVKTLKKRKNNKVKNNKLY